MYAGLDEYLEPSRKLLELRRVMDIVSKMLVPGIITLWPFHQKTRGTATAVTSTPPCTGAPLILGFTLSFVYGTWGVLDIEEQTSADESPLG